MKEAYAIIRDTIKEDWKQAAKEVLSLMAIFALVVVLIGVPLYLYNLPEPVPGIQSAEHREIVKGHLVRK